MIALWIVLLHLAVVINKYLIEQYGKKTIAHALSYPLTGNGSILKTDFICSINGSMDVPLFEYMTCPRAIHRNQPALSFLVVYFCIYGQDIQVEIPNPCLNHTGFGHRIQGLQSCNVFSLLLWKVN